MNIKKLALFSLGPIVGAILGLLILPVSAWFFSTEDIGRLSMYQLIANFSIVLFGLGLDQGYVREFHEVKEENRAILFRTVIITASIVFLSIALISLFLPWNLSYLITGIESNKISIYILLGVSFIFLARFLSLILRMHERALAYSISQIVPKAIFLCVLIGYVALNVSNKFDSLIIAQIIGVAATLFILLFNNKAHLIEVLKAEFNRSLLKSMLIYTLPLILSGILFWALAATDKFFLRAISGFEELGVYSVAFSFAGAALILQSIFSTIWAPQVYKWAVEGDCIYKVQKAVRSISVVILVLWAILGMTTWLVLLVLPPMYSEVDTLILAIVAYPLLYTLSEATAVGINITRKTVLTLIATATALLTNILGNSILVPKYGAQGAAISTAISFVLFFIIKTELSIWVWGKIDRLRSYVLVVGLLFLSIIFNLDKDLSINLRVAVYACYLVITLIVFKKQVQDGFSKMMRQIFKS